MSIRRSSFALLLAFSILALACSPAQTAPGTTSSASAAPIAKVADQITIGLNVNPTSLDPMSGITIPGRAIIDLIAEPLMRQTADGKIAPALATSYERPSDLTWRFHLRSGVKFHDGQSFDADDVVFSMNRFNDKNLPFIDATVRSRAVDIDKVVKVDPMTVDIVTKAPAAFFLRTISLSSFFAILPHTAAAAAGASFGTRPIGTGPYKFVSLAPGQQVVLERNDDYWGDKSPTRRLVFRTLVEDSARVAAFQAGEVQFINAVPIDALQTLKSDKRFRVESAPSQRTIFLAMRTGRSPLNDLRVRQALAHAIDTQALANNLFSGLATPANGPFAPLIFGAAQFPPYSYDPAMAKKLLADAGYPNGIHLTYGIPLGNYLQDKQVGEAIAGMLEKAGISVSGYQEVDWATFRGLATNDKKYDIYLYGLGSTDPAMQAKFLSLDTYTDWKPPERDTLMAQINAGPEDKVGPQLQQLQQLLWNDLPEIFLYYQPTLVAEDSLVEGNYARVDELLDFSRIRWPGK